MSEDFKKLVALPALIRHPTILREKLREEKEEGENRDSVIFLRPHLARNC